MLKFLDLLTSRRAIVAILGFLAPIISDKFGYTLTQDQLAQLTTLVVAVIAALSFRDHNVELEVLPKENKE